MSSKLVNAGVLQLQLDLLYQVIRDLQTHRYLAVTAISCMFYDITLTIEQERSLIWSGPWSFGKVLYFAVRYPVVIEEILFLVFAVDMDALQSFCRFESTLSIWGTLIFLIPLQILVVLRTIAIWERKRFVVALLWSSLVATDIVILVTLARVMHVINYEDNVILRSILGCQAVIVTIDPHMTIPAWAGIIAFDTVLFFLTLTRGLRFYKAAHTRLLTILVRDGFAYYCVMLVLGIANMILLSALPDERMGLATSLMSPLRCSYSIIGSRIILNIRGASATLQSSSSTLGDGCGNAYYGMQGSVGTWHAVRNDIHLVEMPPSSSTTWESRQDFRYA